MQSIQDNAPADRELRGHWLSVLAQAPHAALENALAAYDQPPLHWLRRPQTGLFMLRARAGGTGAQFNLGEASVTRCAVQDTAGRIGVGYVRGGNARHAELVAMLDVLLQDETRQRELLATVITPLAERQRDAHETASRKAASTRVNFYTLAREQS